MATEKTTAKKTEKAILDRITPTESNALKFARATLKNAERDRKPFAQTLKQEERAAELNADDKSPIRDYAAAVEAAKKTLKPLDKSVKAAEKALKATESQVVGARAKRAKAFGKGEVTQVIPHRKPGMFMISVMVDGESITRHCKKIRTGGKEVFVTSTGMQVAA